MITHHLLVAWRNLRKNKSYSLIHFLGLTTALVTCIFLLAFVIQELQFDQFHQKGHQIYRLNVDLKLPDQELKLALAAGVMAPALKDDFPEVEDYVRLASPWSDLVFDYNSQSFFEKNILYADASFFKIFDFQLEEGNPLTALNQPNQVIFSKKMAKKYFGNETALGKTISIDEELFTVTGIVTNPPKNSHIDFDFLISYQTWVKEHPAAETNWTWTNSPTYVVLSENADYQNLNARLWDWMASKLPADETLSMQPHLEPFQNIHFGLARLGELKPTGSKAQLLLLSITGLLILLMALFNYVNLAIALYHGRKKEIGIRKTFGAKKSQVVLQFLSESILLVGLSILCSFWLADTLLPTFNQLTGMQLSYDFINPISLFFAFWALVFGIGLLAGIYPSLLLSNWKPVQLFRGKAINTGRPFGLKQLLIGAQFATSIGLIVTTLIIWNQYQFLTQKDLGFEQDNKLILRFGTPDKLGMPTEIFKKELEKLPEVKGLTFSSHVPTENTHGVFTQIQDEKGAVKSAEVALNLVDAAFLDVFDMKVLAGRNFSSEISQDTVGALIMNEAAVRQMGFASAEAVIGKEFVQWDRQGKVIGVVQDFNQHSLHKVITPMTFQMNAPLFEKVTLSYQTDDLPNFLAKLEANWQQATSKAPFQYSFLNQQIAHQYEAEKRFSNIFISYSLIALLISCLGLYGLLSITISKRMKEIGIRKVLGANASNILYLLSKDYFKLIIIALLVAMPITWYFMNNWLEGFAYRIDIQWWVFVLAGILALGIAFLTVSFQSMKAVLANPVQSLRSE